MADIEGLFPVSYEQSRTRFRQMLPEIKKFWPDAALHQHSLRQFPDLAIDWIKASGKTATNKLLVFTTGEHGIEGFVGSAMLELFFQKYLLELDPDTTGLVLVHAIDPWGMKYFRRTNPNNVDLNRNFVWEISQLEDKFNPTYHEFHHFFGGERKIGPLGLENLGFISGYLTNLFTIGKAKFWAAKNLGQYAFPKGIHYGGTEIQEEVETTKAIFREAFEACGKILHFDMHTGYGPRYQMTIVNSVFEPKSSAEFIQELNYPLVAAMTADEFYEVRGDMVDYVYQLRDREFPDCDLYSTAFEFGTFGDSHGDNYRQMRAMVLENRLYWYGAYSKHVKSAVRKIFRESFYPCEVAWRQKAIEDADQAFVAILKMSGFLGENS